MDSVSVQLRTSGGNPEQDAATLAAVRRLAAALDGEPFSAIAARRAVARMEREAGVRNVDYRLLPQGANALRIQFLVDAAPGRKDGAGVPSGILTGEIADFPVFYKDDRKLVTAIIAGGLGVYSDGNAWFGKPGLFLNPEGYLPGARTTWTEGSLEIGGALPASSPFWRMGASGRGGSISSASTPANWTAPIPKRRSLAATSGTGSTMTCRSTER